MLGTPLLEDACFWLQTAPSAAAREAVLAVLGSAHSLPRDPGVPRSRRPPPAAFFECHIVLVSFRHEHRGILGHWKRSVVGSLVSLLLSPYQYFHNEAH